MSDSSTVATNDVLEPNKDDFEFPEEYQESLDDTHFSNLRRRLRLIEQHHVLLSDNQPHTFFFSAIREDDRKQPMLETPIQTLRVASTKKGVVEYIELTWKQSQLIAKILSYLSTEVFVEQIRTSASATNNVWVSKPRPARGYLNLVNALYSPQNLHTLFKFIYEWLPHILSTLKLPNKLPTSDLFKFTTLEAYLKQLALRCRSTAPDVPDLRSTLYDLQTFLKQCFADLDRYNAEKSSIDKSGYKNNLLFQFDRIKAPPNSIIVVDTVFSVIERSLMEKKEKANPNDIIPTVLLPLKYIDARRLADTVPGLKINPVGAIEEEKKDDDDEVVENGPEQTSKSTIVEQRTLKEVFQVLRTFEGRQEGKDEEAREHRPVAMPPRDPSQLQNEFEYAFHRRTNLVQYEAKKIHDMRTLNEKNPLPSSNELIHHNNMMEFQSQLTDKSYAIISMNAIDEISAQDTEALLAKNTKENPFEDIETKKIANENLSAFNYFMSFVQTYCTTDKVFDDLEVNYDDTRDAAMNRSDPDLMYDDATSAATAAIITATANGLDESKDDPEEDRPYMKWLQPSRRMIDPSNDAKKGSVIEHTYPAKNRFFYNMNPNDLPDPDPIAHDTIPVPWNLYVKSTQNKAPNRFFVDRTHLRGTAFTRFTTNIIPEERKILVLMRAINAVMHILRHDADEGDDHDADDEYTPIALPTEWMLFDYLINLHPYGVVDKQHKRIAGVSVFVPTSSLIPRVGSHNQSLASLVNAMERQRFLTCIPTMKMLASILRDKVVPPAQIAHKFVRITTTIQHIERLAYVTITEDDNAKYDETNPDSIVPARIYLQQRAHLWAGWWNRARKQKKTPETDVENSRRSNGEVLMLLFDKYWGEMLAKTVPHIRRLRASIQLLVSADPQKAAELEELKKDVDQLFEYLTVKASNTQEYEQIEWTTLDSYDDDPTAEARHYHRVWMNDGVYPEFQVDSGDLISTMINANGHVIEHRRLIKTTNDHIPHWSTIKFIDVCASLASQTKIRIHKALKKWKKMLSTQVTWHNSMNHWLVRVGDDWIFQDPDPEKYVDPNSDQITPAEKLERRSAFATRTIPPILEVLILVVADYVCDLVLVPESDWKNASQIFKAIVHLQHSPIATIWASLLQLIRDTTNTKINGVFDKELGYTDNGEYKEINLLAMVQQSDLDDERIKKPFAAIANKWTTKQCTGQYCMTTIENATDRCVKQINQGVTKAKDKIPVCFQDATEADAEEVRLYFHPGYDYGVLGPRDYTFYKAIQVLPTPELRLYNADPLHPAIVDHLGNSTRNVLSKAGTQITGVFAMRDNVKQYFEFLPMIPPQYIAVDEDGKPNREKIDQNKYVSYVNNIREKFWLRHVQFCQALETSPGIKYTHPGHLKMNEKYQEYKTYEQLVESLKNSAIKEEWIAFRGEEDKTPVLSEAERVVRTQQHDKECVPPPPEDGRVGGLLLDQNFSVERRLLLLAPINANGKRTIITPSRVKWDTAVRDYEEDAKIRLATKTLVKKIEANERKRFESFQLEKKKEAAVATIEEEGEVEEGGEEGEVGEEGEGEGEVEEGGGGGDGDEDGEEEEDASGGGTDAKGAEEDSDGEDWDVVDDEERDYLASAEADEKGYREGQEEEYKMLLQKITDETERKNLKEDLKDTYAPTILEDRVNTIYQLVDEIYREFVTQFPRGNNNPPRLGDANVDNILPPARSNKQKSTASTNPSSSSESSSSPSGSAESSPPSSLDPSESHSEQDLTTHHHAADVVPEPLFSQYSIHDATTETQKHWLDQVKKTVRSYKKLGDDSPAQYAILMDISTAMHMAVMASRETLITAAEWAAESPNAIEWALHHALYQSTPPSSPDKTQKKEKKKKKKKEKKDTNTSTPAASDQPLQYTDDSIVMPTEVAEIKNDFQELEIPSLANRWDRFIAVAERYSQLVRRHTYIDEDTGERKPDASPEATKLLNQTLAIFKPSGKKNNTYPPSKRLNTFVGTKEKTPPYKIGPATFITAFPTCFMEERTHWVIPFVVYRLGYEVESLKMCISRRAFVDDVDVFVKSTVSALGLDAYVELKKEDFNAAVLDDATRQQVLLYRLWYSTIREFLLVNINPDESPYSRKHHERHFEEIWNTAREVLRQQDPSAVPEYAEEEEEDEEEEEEEESVPTAPATASSSSSAPPPPPASNTKPNKPPQNPPHRLPPLNNPSNSSSESAASAASASSTASTAVATTGKITPGRPKSTPNPPKIVPILQPLNDTSSGNSTPSEASPAHISSAGSTTHLDPYSALFEERKQRQANCIEKLFRVALAYENFTSNLRGAKINSIQEQFKRFNQWKVRSFQSYLSSSKSPLPSAAAAAAAVASASKSVRFKKYHEVYTLYTE